MFVFVRLIGLKSLQNMKYHELLYLATLSGWALIRLT